MAQSKEKSKTVFTSMCFIGGRIKKLKIQDASAFVLVEVTEDPKVSKWLPCSIYQEESLLKRIARYAEGDYIQFRGYVRAWSQKKENEEWKNAVDVRVTEIRSDDPEPRRNGAPSSWEEPPVDDDIPF